MEARASVKHVRMTPRKVKIVCDLIRGKKVAEAEAILLNTPKAACEPILKLLRSARANAENNYNMDTGSLIVSYIHSGPGPILKRMHARARGRGDRINKRTSHITIAVSEKE